MKFYKPAPFIAHTEHEFTVRPLFISKKTFDKIPPDRQSIVLKSAQQEFGAGPIIPMAMGLASVWLGSN